MSVPTYRWHCFKCDAVNEAGSTACAACGFPAEARGASIANLHIPEKSGQGNGLATFFVVLLPEIIPALVAVIASPYWGIKLMLNDCLGQGIAVLLIGGMGAYGLFKSMLKKQAWLIWGVVVAILIGFVLVDWTLPASHSVFWGGYSKQACQE